MSIITLIWFVACTAAYAYFDIVTSMLLYISAIVVIWLKSYLLFRKHSITLLVIAHPDDEAMFFVPCIQNLQKAGSEFHLLCLTSGNFDGIGKIREKELLESCKVLGINHVQIEHNPAMPDTMQLNTWDLSVARTSIEKYCNKHYVDTIITFDKYGVSGHPNHCDTFLATLQMCKGCIMNPPPRLFILETVNLVRKYTGIMDLLLSATSQFCFVTLNPLTNWKVMRLHASQFVWYRRLFIIFSRYTFMNTLREVDLFK